MIKALRVLFVLALASGLAAWLLKMRPRAERQVPQDIGVLVEVQAAKAGRTAMVVEAYGTVTARRELKVAAEVGGRIVAVHPAFNEGGLIQAGQRILQIDPRTFELEVRRQQVQIQQVAAETAHLDQQVRNFEASIGIVQSDVKLALAELERIRKLIGKNVVAQTTLDQTEQRYLARREKLQQLKNELALTGPAGSKLAAQSRMARVLLQQARLNLEKTDIVASFTSWVREKQVELGQHAHAGQYLATIYKSGAYDVVINLPVGELKWLCQTDCKADSAKVIVHAAVGNSSTEWPGRLARAKAAIDTGTRTQPFVVEVETENGDPGQAATDSHPLTRLKPGLFVKVTITGKTMENIFVLPRHLVRDGDVIYTVSDQRLQMKTVQILRRHKEQVFVAGGLADGDLVVVSPLPAPREGMKIRIP